MCRVLFVILIMIGVMICPMVHVECTTPCTMSSIVYHMHACGYTLHTHLCDRLSWEYYYLHG